MRAAATIYQLSAIAILSFMAFLLFTYGAGVGLLVLALAACALWLLARGLIGGNASACRGAIALSSFLAVGFTLVSLYLYAQAGWAAVSNLWAMTSAFLALAGAHAMALVFLFRAKPTTP